MRWQMVTPTGTVQNLLPLSKTQMTNDDLQDYPIHQVGMMFTEAISFRKVRIGFQLLILLFWEFAVNHLVQKDLQW
jgi:hypothetical protein